MIKTFTPTNFKNLSEVQGLEQVELSNEKFYTSIKQNLNKLHRDPSEETIAKILNYAKKR